MRQFSPLSSDHPLVKDEVKCAICHEPFIEGAVTSLIPVPIEGKMTVPALVVHWKCYQDFTS